MKRMRFLFLSIGMLVASSIYADDYIAVNKAGNIYDQSNAKYITENQNGNEINVVPGMIFKTSEHVPGWYKIEYSPGLHAYIPEQLIASSFKAPQPGNYKVSNNPSQTLNINNQGNDWTCEINGKTYNGRQVENFLIFNDGTGNPIFTLVDLGNGGVAITYDNDVTKFF